MGLLEGGCGSSEFEEGRHAAAGPQDDGSSPGRYFLQSEKEFGSPVQLLMINIRWIPFLAVWLGYSFKESTRRACTGAPTDLTCTLESEPGTGFCDDLVLLLSFALSVDSM